MKRTAFLFLAFIFLLPASAFSQENMVESELRQLVEEERKILEGSRMANGSYDEELLARRFQGLVHKFDSFVNEHPDFPVGYVAYARVLERIGQDDAARAMYMKANELDPNIPLVKNQLGNYLAEEEDFAQALPYYLAAIELEPDEPLYHYQLGNLLHHFQEGFIEEEIFTRAVIDRKMLEAFKRAAELAPDEMAFAYRHAETFYDLEEPDWEEALRAWKKLEAKATSAVEIQTIYLHRANIALKQNNREAARKLLENVTEPVLQSNKARLEKRLKENEAGKTEETDG